MDRMGNAELRIKNREKWSGSRIQQPATSRVADGENGPFMSSSEAGAGQEYRNIRMYEGKNVGM